MATVFMSMATRLSDLDDQKSGVNLQTEGHTFTQQSGQNSPDDPEVFGSAPSWSPSQSLDRKPGCHETQYCLEIQVISTKDERATAPPSHIWLVPIVEDRVWDGKAGLTEAVVTSPGRAILFYGWWSLGEGLSLGEVQDAAFMLSGHIKPRGTGHPHSIPPASIQFKFHNQDLSLQPANIPAVA